MNNTEIINLKKYVVENGLERMNRSFSKNRINDKNETFYANKTAERFVEVSKKYNIPLNYENFYNYLNKYILKSKGGFECFLDERIDKWFKKEKQFSKKDMRIYIRVKFIYDTLSGQLREQNVKNELKKKCIYFTNPSEDEDIKLAYDLKLSEDKIIQIKPLSWFNSNDYKQRHTIKGIENAIKKNISIFLVIYDEKLEKSLVLTRNGFKDLITIKDLDIEEVKYIIKNKLYKIKY